MIMQIQNDFQGVKNYQDRENHPTNDAGRSLVLTGVS